MIYFGLLMKSNKQLLIQITSKLLLGILLFITFICCNRNRAIFQGETISIDIGDLSTVGYPDLFSKIEIIPLETNDESLLKYITKLYVDEKNGDFIIFDRGQGIMFCFNEKGQFKYSSKKMIGNGPGEYYQPYDFVYNPFHSTHEFLNPMGIISIYGDNMDFIRSLKIESNNKVKAIHYFFPINDDTYVLYNVSDLINQIYFYSLKNNLIIKNQPMGTRVLFTSNPMPFYLFQDSCYFSPASVSNIEYQINPNNLTLFPVMQIDYGNKTLTSDIAKDYQDYGETRKLLESGAYAFSSGKFQNDEFYFIYTIYNNQGYFAIYDKQTKTVRTYRSFSNKKIFPQIKYLTNDVLYCISNVYDIQYSVDERLLNQKDKELLSKLKEDDNPIIIKAYFKNELTE